MINEHSTPDLPISRDSQDDICALSEAFSLQDWHYVDIARQERLAGILTRWPLLAEFITDTYKDQ